MPLSNSMACSILFFPFFTRASTEGTRSNPPNGHKVAALHGCPKLKHVSRTGMGNHNLKFMLTQTSKTLITCPAERQRSSAFSSLPALNRVQISSRRDSSCFCVATQAYYYRFKSYQNATTQYFEHSHHNPVKI